MKNKFFIFFILLCNITFAQKYITVKDSLTQKPIVNVSVYSSAGYGYATDISGGFDLNKFDKKDTLTFSHLLYKKKKILVKNLFSKKKIYLLQKNISTGSVIVTDKYSGNNVSVVKEKIVLDEKYKSGFFSISKVLNNSSSLYIKDYGGEGALKTVSSRGLSSENTVVLFNEARVSDIRSGAFDFSRISTQAIDKIEFYKSSDFDDYRSAAGGVVKIYSGNIRNETKANFFGKISKDGLKSFGGDYKDIFGNFSCDINFERSYSPNNYKYEFLGKNYKRRNAFFSKIFLSGTINWKLENVIFKFYSNYSHFKNGIPGFVVTNNDGSSKAIYNTDSRLSVLNAEVKLTENLFWHSTLNHNHQEIDYYDPLQDFNFASEGKVTKINEYAFNNRIKSNNEIFNYSLGYEFNYTKLDGMGDYMIYKDVPKNIFRNTNRIYLSLGITQKLILNSIKFFSLNFATGYEGIAEEIRANLNKKTFSYNVGLTLVPLAFDFITFRANVFYNHRSPTVNERYYNSLFKTSILKPEKYKGFDFGFDVAIDFPEKTYLSLSYFDTNGEDKIIWLPTTLGQQVPTNLGNAKINGLEASLRTSFWNRLITLDVIYNLTNARNRTDKGPANDSYDKYLIYSPLHRLNINTSLNIKDFNFTFYYSLVSKRYFTGDNYYRSRLNGYSVVDLVFNYQFKLFNRKQQVAFNAYNIFNKQYMVIQSYPMPLTNFSLTYKLELL